MTDARPALVRLASQWPKGSKERRDLLAIAKRASPWHFPGQVPAGDDWDTRGRDGGEDWGDSEEGPEDREEIVPGRAKILVHELTAIGAVVMNPETMDFHDRNEGVEIAYHDETYNLVTLPGDRGPSLVLNKIFPNGTGVARWMKKHIR